MRCGFGARLRICHPKEPDLLKFPVDTCQLVLQCSSNMLGEFEYLLLSATIRLGEDAYGVSIRREIEHYTKRNCSVGALYTTLDRLETKGLIETWMGGPTAQRGGRRKRMVRVTAKGLGAASAFYHTVVRASQGVLWETNQGRVTP